MKTLKEMEGEEIVALIPFIHQTHLQRVILHRVEDAGLWLESQNLIEAMLKTINQGASPKTAVFFLPWHQISFLLGSLDKTAISEKSLGL